MPNVNETVVETRNATILSEEIALHLRAEKTFVDIYEIERKAGEEWII